MKKMSFGFGPHLMLDLWHCNKKRLADSTHVFSILDTLPEQIGMTKLTTPQIFPYQGKEDSFDKGGISAFILIAESHITIHTFEEQAHAFIDIFSCKEFDIDKAVNYLITAFEAKKYKKTISNRGHEFPKEVTSAVNIVKNERREIQDERN